MKDKLHGNSHNQYAKKERSATAMLTVRLSAEDKAQFVQRAREEGKSLSMWILERLNKS